MKNIKRNEISNKLEMLTPNEIEELRRDKKETNKRMKELFSTTKESPSQNNL